MNVGNKTRILRLAASVFIFLIFPVTIFMVGTPPSHADSAGYFYDDLGRLTRVVKGTSSVIYTYDELGNVVSVTNSTTSIASPVISAISPNVLLVGSKMSVTITGQNLLTTESVTSNGGLVTIENVTVTDTQITADMTAHSAGTDIIKVTTIYGTPNTAETGVTLSSSRLTFSPSQLALMPGGSGTVTASISPQLTVPLTINLDSTNPSVATVPQSITIPVNGSADFTVNAVQTGVATVGSGAPGTVVFVTSPFTGDVNGLVTPFISVSIDAAGGTSTSVAHPVSVAMDAPSGTSSSAASPVSVSIDAPSGTSSSVATEVSVAIDASSGASTSAAIPVSVTIDASADGATTTANPVSVKTQ